MLDDISVNKSVTIDDALKQHIKNTEGVLDPQILFEEKEKISNDVAQFLSLQTNLPDQSILILMQKILKHSPEETLHIRSNH